MKKFILFHICILLLLSSFIFNTSCNKSTFTIENVNPNIYPPENISVYQNLLLFEYTSIQNANKYVIEVASRLCISFEKSCVVDVIESSSLTGRSTKKLNFGEDYIWRVKAFNKNTLLNTSKLYYFKIEKSPRIDSLKFKNTIVQHNKAKLKEGYLFLDNLGVIIDLMGKPVWFSPYPGGANGLVNGNILNNGNFAFIDDRRGFYEVNLFNQALLNKETPIETNDFSCNSFHHSYQHLSNGNFTMLGLKHVNKPLRKGDRFEKGKLYDGDNFEISPAPYSIIMEIDGNTGELVWEYDLIDFIEIENKKQNINIFGNGHINSVYEDEASGIIYISCRDLSRIIKIDKKTKSVLGSYGRNVGIGSLDKTINLFDSQHSVELDKDGNILLFNNSSGLGEDSISSIILLTPEFELLWEYKCNFGDKTQSWSKAKGDVDEFNNDNYLIGMGTIPRTFVVNKNKEILWECLHKEFRTKQVDEVLGEDYRKKYPREKIREVQKTLQNKEWLPTYYNYSANWITDLYPNYYSCTLVVTNGEFYLHLHNDGNLNNTVNWSIHKSDETIASDNTEIAKKSSVKIPIVSLLPGSYVIELISKYNYREAKKYEFIVSKN